MYLTSLYSYKENNQFLANAKNYKKYFYPTQKIIKKCLQPTQKNY